MEFQSACYYGLSERVVMSPSQQHLSALVRVLVCPSSLLPSFILK